MEFTNKNTGLFYYSAKALLLPVQIIHCIDGFSFHLGKKIYFFRGFETPFNNNCSTRIAENKYCVNQLLEGAGIPVPKAVSIHINEFETGQLATKISCLTFPLVLKPTIGSLGRNVYCNIPDLEQLTALMTKCFAKSEWLTVEEFHGKLNSYRVLVFKRRIMGVVQRYPARVFGDGLHTITELIKVANTQREQSGDELKPIVLDEESHFRLQELGITPDYIPNENELVVLGYTCNASRGGTYEAINSKLCKENRQLFIKIVSLLNLDLAGIDIECIDINKPIADASGVIIEVNSDPSIRIHERPQQGKARPITKKMIRSIIYRHPWSFCWSLFENKQTAFYARTSFLLILIAIILKFII